MRTRLTLAALALSLAVGACDGKAPTSSSTGDDWSPNSAAAQASVARLVLRDVTGPLDDGGTFRGTLIITQFARDGAGRLLASGTLRGNARQGATVTQINQAFENVRMTLRQGSAQGASVTPASNTFEDLAAALVQGRVCRILHLDLGPLFLDVLGLRVNLSRVVLDITAVAGPGNLLGNLLCALVGLLDRTPINLAILDALLNLINLILA